MYFRMINVCHRVFLLQDSSAFHVTIPLHISLFSTGLKYLSKNRTVITISRDPFASLVIRQIKGKFDSYIFKLGWGVRCFDHVSTPTLSIVVTGSNDKIVRVWNPVVTTKPIHLLSGHKSGINDVKIRDDKRLIFSYDKNAVLKIWDIDIGYCLQTMPLRFPR